MTDDELTKIMKARGEAIGKNVNQLMDLGSWKIALSIVISIAVSRAIFGIFDSPQEAWLGTIAFTLGTILFYIVQIHGLLAMLYALLSFKDAGDVIKEFEEIKNRH